MNVSDVFITIVLLWVGTIYLILKTMSDTRKKPRPAICTASR
jgi:hypothetical protein